jgi:hypothetical protein
MTPSPPPQDLATQWKSACRLYPVYFEIAREFAIEVEACSALEAGGDIPDDETVQQSIEWIEQLDQRIQVHQLRQFLQTNSLAGQDSFVTLLQYFLSQPVRSDATRDKVDFLLVQYFSQIAPSQLDDNEVDLAYVIRSLEPVLGPADPRSPVWLNVLDRVLESARRCRSLDELLHSGVLEQGRKAKLQAGDLFFLPTALVAFTRYGYLMRRVFFRLMHGDLNAILDGLDALEAKGVETIDCRRAQFSEQEPILRLRMICQSWKVLFQAEYSSGQPLRMLVDLRASVDQALGTETPAAQPVSSLPAQPVAEKAAAAVAASSAGNSSAGNSGSAKKSSTGKSKTNLRAPVVVHENDAPEFEVTASADWDAAPAPPLAKKK